MGRIARVVGFLLLAFTAIDSIGFAGTSEDKIRRRDIGYSKHEDLIIRHVYKESIPQLSTRNDIAIHERLHHEYLHDVIFVIRQKNMEELTRILHDVSDPNSPNYGHHLSKSDVTEMTSNPDGRNAVLTYLNIIGAVVTSESLGGAYITAKAPISLWEKVFDAEFRTFHQTHYNGRVDKIVRSEKYSIPIELDEHVESVFNTIQMPLQIFGDSPVMQSAEDSTDEFDSAAYSFPGFTTPAKIMKRYNMGTSKGSTESTQGIFATKDQYYSPADLAYFQNFLSLRVQSVLHTPGGHSSDAACRADSGQCSEGNLDVQYIMSTSQVSPTTYWYSDLLFADWLVTVANTANPPLVFSISYGAEEFSVTMGELSAFNTQAIQLAVTGVSIVVASGDDGAISRKVRTRGVSECRYTPLYPASSPYVISVGGTSGVDNGAPEVVCQADITNAITSGGGFSTGYPQPLFQKDAVDSYFKKAAAAGQSPVAGYAGSGRGYPDVSLAALSYAVVIGKTFFKISGTSAAAPVMAGFLSNVNADRIALGKGPVGWINPALYTYADSIVNDITSGNNFCAASGQRCPQGFYATPGWDPATGLGSVDFAKFQNVFVNLGTVNSADTQTRIPSLNTTPSPSLPKPPPTRKRTKPLSPSRAPVSVTPTRTPSALPPGDTDSPALYNETYSPTGKNAKSSKKPTRSPTVISTSLAPSKAKEGSSEPTAVPTYSSLSSFQVYQTVTGITYEDASSQSFITALENTVSDVLNVSSYAVTNVIISNGKRRLLSAVGMDYDVSVNSGVSKQELIQGLRTSVSTGEFLSVLKYYCELPVTSVSEIYILGVAPTTSPSSALDQKTKSASSMTVVYVTTSVAGLILLIITVVLIICYVPSISGFGSPHSAIQPEVPRLPPLSISSPRTPTSDYWTQTPSPSNSNKLVDIVPPPSSRRQSDTIDSALNLDNVRNHYIKEAVGQRSF